MIQRSTVLGSTPVALATCSGLRPLRRIASRSRSFVIRLVSPGVETSRDVLR